MEAPLKCKCGALARPNFKTCQKCADKAAKDARERYAKKHPKMPVADHVSQADPNAPKVTIGAPGKTSLIVILQKQITLRRSVLEQLTKEIEALEVSVEVLSAAKVPVST